MYGDNDDESIENILETRANKRAQRSAINKKYYNKKKITTQIQ